jgi:hypothetical protein
MKAFLAWSAALIVSVSGAEAPEISDDTLRAYAKTMHRMNDQPHSVATERSILCVLPPSAAAEQKRTGPHFGHWLNVFMNEPARKHFVSKAERAYPPGSIIVKEKRWSTVAGDTHTDFDGVGGLIKHAPGYNAASGDWEFFYIDRLGKMERAQVKLVSCADCHKNATTDYVFGDFAKPSTAKSTL